MKASMKKKRGVVGAVVLAGILSVGGYALTNTITFEEAATTAGFGSQEVRVLQVKDIDYKLGSVANDGTGDMTKIYSIDFILDKATITGANDANAWINYNDGTAAGAWTSCGVINPDAAIFTCDTSATPIAVQDIGEDTTGRVAQAPGTAGVAGGVQPLRLVIAE